MPAGDTFSKLSKTAKIFAKKIYDVTRDGHNSDADATTVGLRDRDVRRPYAIVQLQHDGLLELVRRPFPEPVSYTHLTLPTIPLV